MISAERGQTSEESKKDDTTKFYENASQSGKTHGVFKLSGVTLVNKIIWVSSVQYCNMLSVYCIVRILKGNICHVSPFKLIFAQVPLH